MKREKLSIAIPVYSLGLRSPAIASLSFGAASLRRRSEERSVAGELLIEPRFTADDLARLKALLVDESRFRLEKYPIRAGVFKDNVPESNLWNGSVMFRTAWS